MKVLPPALVLAVLALRPSVGPAQEHPHASQAEQLGAVHFATSCSPAVSPVFDRAIALLHSFEFGQALEGFSQVLAADSGCAMAHWGIALVRWGNPMAAGNRSAAQLRQGAAAVAAARRVAPSISERERGYIEAVSRLYEDFERIAQPARVQAYERAMRELVERQPADTEAKIFHAIALVASASPTDKTFAKQLEAGSILEPLWAAQPNHPGLAHYIIHTYDYPPLASKAQAAARRYATIAPSAAHALHMPSHTFTRVGLWQESVEANHRSMETALRSGSIAETLHAADYAIYAYLQLGQEREAKAILARLPDFAARFDPNAIGGAAPPSAGFFAMAAIPARWALEREAWAEAAALEPRPTDYPYTEAMTYFARALGAARTRDLGNAKAAVDSLASIEKRLVTKGEPYWAEQVAIQRLGAEAWLDLAEGRKEPALERMREAARREDATEKSAVTPGPLAPARELLGDMLRELGRFAEAKAEYRATLGKEPNRRRSMVKGEAKRVSPPGAQ
jgi:hypothetical protein